MNAILGYGQLLQTSEGLSAEQRRKLDVIRASGEHLLTLINDILDMSRIEAGRVTISVEPFDLRAVLGEIGSMFASQSAARGLALDIHQDHNLPPAMEADPGKVRQVLINLVGNAVKFTESGGVRLRAHHRPVGESACEITIEVEDTGPGIPASELETIFDPFTQTEAGARKGGTGLGLSVSRSFARLMSGDLFVRSEPGRGSTFVFTFAGAIVPSEALHGRSPRANGKRLAAGETRRRILVVDDVPSNRELMEESLSRVGFEVRSVTSGEEALTAHEEWRPDLIISDLHMPGIGGAAAIRLLRANGATVPIIVTSASSDTAADDAVRAAGAQHLLRKPYREREFLTAIGAVLGIEFVSAPDPVKVAAAEPPPASPLVNLAREIPAPLVAELRDAARRARANRIREVIGEVEAHVPAAAAAIRELADNFRYADILQALEGEPKRDG